MKLLRLVPANTKFPFLKYARIAMIGSCLAFLASIALFFTVGLNLGNQAERVVQVFETRPDLFHLLLKRLNSK